MKLGNIKWSVEGLRSDGHRGDYCFHWILRHRSATRMHLCVRGSHGDYWYEEIHKELFLRINVDVIINC